MLNLRDYQSSSIEKLRGAFAAHKAIMLYAPTGSGKTETAIALLSAAADKGSRVAMIMDRRVLCDQTSKRLEKYAIDHGVLMSGHWRYRPDRQIQICSVQTLEARESFPGLKLLIVDEAHCNRASIIEFIENHPEVRVIGLSASPFTKGLGNYYSHVVNAITTRELVDQGMLAPLRVFRAKEIDMTGAEKNFKGEWSDAEVTKRGAKIVGDIVAEWLKKTHEIFGGPRKTICFCAGVEHGKSLATQFQQSGYNFLDISHKDSDEYKAEVLAEFAKLDSDIVGIISTDILTKGFDQADVCIGISARPFTKSFSSHVQQLGRVMRPHPDKAYAVWLDHSGNYLRFKDQWDELYSSGVDELNDSSEVTKKEPTAKEKEAAHCPVCGAFWVGGSDSCVHCGAVRVVRNTVHAVAGEMEELGNEPVKEKFSSEYKESFYRGLLGYARQKGWQEGWAYHQYKEKFGIYPPWKKVAEFPSEEVKNWIKHKHIAFAKRKAA